MTLHCITYGISNTFTAVQGEGNSCKLTSSFPPPVPAYIIANAMAWLESSVICMERENGSQHFVLRSLQTFCIYLSHIHFCCPK